MCSRMLRRIHRACFVLSAVAIGMVLGSMVSTAVAAESVAQQAYVKASNTGADDEFGRAVSVWGDTLVVGAGLEDSGSTGVNGNQADESLTDSGAVYVFVRSGSTWSQQAYLKASNPGSEDYFGFSVAIHGDTIVVGAYREDSGATGVNGNQADESAIDSGAAYVFVRNGSTWSQQAYLKPSNTGSQDQFGRAVAIHGDTIVVGSWFEDSNATGVNGNANDNSASDSGAAFVFTRSGTAWSQQAYLKASNTGAGDRFGGFQVAVAADTAVVGAYLEDSNATGVNGNQGNNSADAAGAVYVFTRSGTVWSQQAYLKASNTGTSDWFGSALSISGDTLVVGAYREDSLATGVNGDGSSNGAPDAGAAYVFSRSGGSWSQEAYLKASNTWPSDWFGYAVAITGDTIVVGAHQEDSAATGVNGNQADNSADSSGAAYAFTRSGSTWSQFAYLKASNTQSLDDFGYSVAAAADTIVLSSLYEDSNATGIDGDGSNNAASGSGAVYVFTAPCSGAIAAYGAGCAGSGGFVPSLAATGCAMNDGFVTITIGNALGGSVATLLLGIASASLPVGGGCGLLVYPAPMVMIAGIPLGGLGPGMGSISIPSPIPATLPPLTVFVQAAIVDPGNVLGVTLTNGLQLTIG